MIAFEVDATCKTSTGHQTMTNCECVKLSVLVKAHQCTLDFTAYAAVYNGGTVVASTFFCLIFLTFSFAKNLQHTQNAVEVEGQYKTQSLFSVSHVILIQNLGLDGQRDCLMFLSKGRLWKNVFQIKSNFTQSTTVSLYIFFSPTKMSAFV